MPIKIGNCGKPLPPGPAFIQPSIADKTTNKVMDLINELRLN